MIYGVIVKKRFIGIPYYVGLTWIESSNHLYVDWSLNETKLLELMQNDILGHIVFLKTEKDFYYKIIAINQTYNRHFPETWREKLK